MNLVIELNKEMLALHCLLPCTHCRTTTNHVLSRSKEFYACSCGEIIDIEFKEDKEEIENEAI
jgi:hypothetical protein